MLMRLVVRFQTETPTDPAQQVVERVSDVAWWFGIVNSATRAAIVLVAAFVLARLAKRGVRRWVSRATVRSLSRMDETRRMRAELRAKTLGDVMADSTRVVIWTLAVITALGQFGIALGPLIAGAGIAGVALGFGAQSLVKDFFSGFFILLEDQYGVGDVVQVDPDVSGRVEDITMRVTRLRSLDGTVWFVPNGEVRFLGNRSKEWARALVDFQVSYGSDLDDAMEVIRDAAAELRQSEEIGPKILEDVEILGVEMLGDSGVTIRTFIKTQPLEQWTVSRHFRREVKRGFDARGIEIPFPHRKLIIADGRIPRQRPDGPGAVVSSESGET